MKDLFNMTRNELVVLDAIPELKSFVNFVFSTTNVCKELIRRMGEVLDDSSIEMDKKDLQLLFTIPLNNLAEDFTKSFEYDYLSIIQYYYNIAISPESKDVKRCASRMIDELTRYPEKYRMDNVENISKESEDLSQGALNHYINASDGRKAKIMRKVKKSEFVPDNVNNDKNEDKYKEECLMNLILDKIKKYSGNNAESNSLDIHVDDVYEYLKYYTSNQSKKYIKMAANTLYVSSGKTMELYPVESILNFSKQYCTIEHNEFNDIIVNVPFPMKLGYIRTSAYQNQVVVPTGIRVNNINDYSYYGRLTGGNQLDADVNCVIDDGYIYIVLTLSHSQLIYPMDSFLKLCFTKKAYKRWW